MKRLDEARRHLPKGFVWDYFIGPTESPDTVVCKLSKVTLVEKRPVGSRIMMLPTAAYGEIEISFDDGSKHITPISLNSAHNLTNNELECLYCADLAQWVKEGQDINPVWANRKPTGYVIKEQ